MYSEDPGLANLLLVNRNITQTEQRFQPIIASAHKITHLIKHCLSKFHSCSYSQLSLFCFARSSTHKQAHRSSVCSACSGGNRSPDLYELFSAQRANICKGRFSRLCFSSLLTSRHSGLALSVFLQPLPINVGSQAAIPGSDLKAQSLARARNWNLIPIEAFLVESN